MTRRQNPYAAALALVQKIADEEFRRAAIEGLIAAQVKREKGFADPAGELAMGLRREALQQR